MYLYVFFNLGKITVTCLGHVQAKCGDRITTSKDKKLNKCRDFSVELSRFRYAEKNMNMVIVHCGRTHVY